MKHKPDIEIAQRSYDFFIEKFGSVTNGCKCMKISRNSVYQWKNGASAPSAYHLQYLTQLGADPKYLLTGKRTNNVNL